ncbi:MAG: 50S ribosomal protein L4 [Proteobacteria bacterium]|jgi:large subunit ribosomal protein L4|nr:50S ribosomal protein L4 [Pseudomonadota bacterium]
MKLDLYNLANQKIGEVEVSDEVFGAEVRPYLFHEVVKMQLACRRRGTHKGKTRSEVSGGGKKPFKQKGTGNARQGTTRAPHMVGGGWAFAKRNRDYSYSLNKKKCRAALRSVLSMAAGEGRIKVVDAFDLSEIKTRAAVKALSTLEVKRGLVIDCKANDVAEKATTLNNENLRLSVRNLQDYKYLRPEGVNVYDVLHYGSVVVTKAGLERLEARLK